MVCRLIRAVKIWWAILPKSEAFGHRFQCPSLGGVSPPFRVAGLACMAGRHKKCPPLLAWIHSAPPWDARSSDTLQPWSTISVSRFLSLFSASRCILEAESRMMPKSTRHRSSSQSALPSWASWRSLSDSWIASKQYFRHGDVMFCSIVKAQPGQAGIEYWRLYIEDLWYRSPRRRRYNPYEPEASLCLFNLKR